MIKTFKISQEEVNIRFSGLNTEEYNKNPIVLLNHNFQAQPIGKVLSISSNEEEQTLSFEVELNTKDYKEDYLNSVLDNLKVSFGVLIKEFEVSKKEGEEEEQNIITSDLLEISLVEKSEYDK